MAQDVTYELYNINLRQYTNFETIKLLSILKCTDISQIKVYALSLALSKTVTRLISNTVNSFLSSRNDLIIIIIVIIILLSH